MDRERLIRMGLQIFVGIPAMVGLYFAVRWIVDSNESFGAGLFAGIMLTAAMFWLIERFDPESFYGRRDRRLKEFYGDGAD